MTYQVPIYKMALIREGEVKVPQELINNPDLAAHAFRKFFDGAVTEQLAVLLLDVQNKLIGMVPIASGGLGHVKVNMRILLAPLFRHNANAWIFGHNHTSGDPTPSQDDLYVFRHLRKVSEMIECALLDAIIIGDGTLNYYSFESQKCLTSAFLKPAPAVRSLYGDKEDQ